MKLGITHKELNEKIGGQFLVENDQDIDVVFYDTRRIIPNLKGVFFAIKGKNKSGIEFISKAHSKNVRCFVVEELPERIPENSSVILVKNVLFALQELAKQHRNKFSIPIIAITGSLGKTICKEWLYYLLKTNYKVIRTPKSYNSQLGVALSLLEIDDSHEVGIFEADISHPNEMVRLEEIISPTLGIFTNIGKHHQDNFDDEKHHLDEHLKLFIRCNYTFILDSYHSVFRKRKLKTIETSMKDFTHWNIDQLPFTDNRALCLKCAEFFGINELELKTTQRELPVLSGRQETLEGINNNIIINDSYNIDIDALEQALEGQVASNIRKKKVVVLDLKNVAENKSKQIIQTVQKYRPSEVYLTSDQEFRTKILSLKDSLILFKGPFSSSLSYWVNKIKKQSHETWVEFNLKAIRDNLNFFQNLVPQKTKMLVMVKASTYGAGNARLPHFFQENGADYLGVAFTDEGVALRKAGIDLPIIVMNCESKGHEDLFKYNLEPSIGSFNQLASFLESVVLNGLLKWPIHIKVETGMNRLGFKPEVISQLVTQLKSNESLEIKSVFSHLSDADNVDSSFTNQQIATFNQIKNTFKQEISQEILFHILNTEGLLRYAKEASFDMVRIGIGIFGYSSSIKQLSKSISWFTTIAQINHIKNQESVGYARSFKATKNMKIAVVRVGYADGLSRRLGNGKGRVFINNKACKIIGNICMDLTMVDVTNVEYNEKDVVEIIGNNQTLDEFARLMETIPYEVMTSLSPRVPKLFIDV